MTTTSFDQPKAFLIVDDEPLVRLEFRQVVEQCGFKALEAANTAEALRLLDNNASAFSCLITDISMPGSRSGTVLANHVGYVWPHIDIIVISGARHPMQGELPHDAAFLPKPVPHTKLLAVIEALTNGRHGSEQEPILFSRQGRSTNA